MKKNYPFYQDLVPGLRKLFLIMKISLILILFSLSAVASSIYSQTATLNLNLNKVTISKVFDEIEKQSDFYFFYNKNQIDEKKWVSINCDQEKIDVVLDKILTDPETKYEIADKFIFIFNQAGTTQSTNNFQEKTITGTVKSCDDNQPLPGVSVIVKGTSNGTITNMDGQYSILVPQTATLVFSFIGMATQEIAVGTQTTIDVELCSDMIGLDEVIVVGYGTMKKSDLTGAVASVKSEDLNKVAASNPTEALQGRVAGVSVTKIGGAPGGDIDIKIRGVGTFGNNKPLVVIDGIKGDLNYLNQSDIESIEVLKDGAAAAIYGAEAANGVILVTTKKGQAGTMKVDLGAYLSMNKAINRFEMLDASGYKKIHKAMYEAAGEAIPEYATAAYEGANTNWIDEVLQPGLAQNYNVRLSGGNELASFALSGQFSDENGIVLGSGYKKNLLKARTILKKSIFNVDASLSYIETKHDYCKLSLRETYHISPLTPVMDPTQDYGYGLSDLDAGIPHHDNPIAEDFYNDNTYENHYIISNFNFGIDFTDYLKWQTKVGIENSNGYGFKYAPAYMSNPKEPHEYPVLSESRDNWRQLLVENLLHFNKSFDEHNVSAVAGITSFKETSSWMNAGVEGKTVNRSVVDGEIVEEEVAGGFLDDEFTTLNGGAGGTFEASGSNYTYTRASVLGRVNYNYASKYYFQATVRRDGSSKFGKNNKYGVFPSFALGWRLSEEDFMDYAWLDHLKLRASYGILGNEITLGYYDYQPLMFTSNDYYGGYVRGAGRNPWPGTIAHDLENDNLRWEETKSTNIGVDFTLFSNITGVINYYNNKTDGLLITKLVPPSGGVGNPIVNVGELYNRGLELELKYYKSTGNFKYGMGATFSTLKNEVTKLSAEDQALYGSGLKYGTEHFPTQTRVGDPIGAFYLYETDGLFQSDEEAANYVNAAGERMQPSAMAGDVKFKDSNGDGVIDDEDKVYSGSGIPTYEYGVNFDASYKGFDLTLFIQGVGGNKIYNGNRFELEGMDGGRNFLATTEDFWTPDNTDTDMPRAVLGDPNGNNRESDRFLEDGAYLRLKTLQLGYSLPKSLLNKVNIEKVRFYATGQNLLTFTNYSGVDPEVGRSSALNTGVDVAIYPIARSLIFGVQLTF